MDRRWDNPTSANTSPNGLSQTQCLPGINDLAKGVPANGNAEHSPTFPPNHSVRDSGNWSMQTPSKHSSVISSAASGLQLPSIASQHNSSNGHYSAAAERSPFSSSFAKHLANGQPAPATEQPNPGLTQINQPFDFNQPRANSEFPQESRRSSIASGVGHLAIQSPLPSNNASQTSLANNLQRERGIPDQARTNGYTNGSSSVLSPQGSMSNRRTQRTAPPINPNPRAEWPNVYADAPTKGHPYAFPDPEMSKNLGNVEEERATSSHHSRRDSLGAASVNSSIFTSDSRLPNGQQRLEMEDHSSPNDDEGSISYYHNHSASDLSSVAHHHHQLQHKQLSGLIGPPDSPSGGTPYSRTPELRVSHKLAERKRRSEMKGLFDELRTQLPPDTRASKTSKWEILTRAVDHIKFLANACEQNRKAMDVYHEHANRAFLVQQENKELHDEIGRLRQQLHYQQQNPQQQQQQQQQQGPVPVGPQAAGAPRPTLPNPVGGGQAAQAAPSGPMQGIQYST